MKSAAEHNAKLIAEYEEQIQVKVPVVLERMEHSN